MKTLVSLLSVLLIPAFSVFASTMNDSDPSSDLPFCYSAVPTPVFSMEEESYIDDIPFDTEKIYKRACCYYKHYGRYSADLTLGEEPYIEDIPFSTIEIASAVMNGTYLMKPCQHTFFLMEEPYIDDIPFKTEEVIADSLEKQEKEKESYTITSFNLRDEEYIDDIPWDTREIFAEVIHYPEFARKCKMEGSVLVTFHYNEDGYIKVDLAESKCDFLKDYIMQTLEEIRLTKGIVTVEKEYNARFDFILR
jgi:hypothetical protein